MDNPLAVIVVIIGAIAYFIMSLLTTRRNGAPEDPMVTEHNETNRREGGPSVDRPSHYAEIQ